MPDPETWGPRRCLSWLEVVVRLGLVVVARSSTLPLLVGQTEHKVMAHMQGRLGPMYAGGFHGWAQLVADGVKFVQKEDVVPAAADRTVFRLAPAVALIPYLVALVAIPVGPALVGADLDVGLFFVLAVLAVGVLGTLMAGWASANKYSLLGGMRAAAQLMAYELPFVLAAASVAMAAGTLSLVGIVEAWQPWWLLWQLPGAGRVLRRRAGRAAAAAVRHAGRGRARSSSARCTEYTGLRFAFFLLAEYAGIVVLCRAHPCCSSAAGTARSRTSSAGCGRCSRRWRVAFVVIWLRVAWPRLREDQLQRLAWLVLVPLALLQLALTGVVVVP